MMMHQNFKGDFIRVEQFYRTEENGEQRQIPVPENLRIEYFTKGFNSRYIIERNGDHFQSCSLSDDGMSLISNIALSRSFIGCGEMFARMTIFISDYKFPDGQRAIPMTIATGLILWPGNSDASPTSHGENVLSPIMSGYSAYELARKYGYEGTEEEYAMEPARIVNQFKSLAEEIDKAIREEIDRATAAEEQLANDMLKSHLVEIDNNPMIISHGLNRFPSVTVISSDKEKVECVVRYESKDVVSVSWNGELSGMIYLI